MTRSRMRTAGFDLVCGVCGTTQYQFKKDHFPCSSGLATYRTHKWHKSLARVQLFPIKKPMEIYQRWWDADMQKACKLYEQGNIAQAVGVITRVIEEAERKATMRSLEAETTRVEKYFTEEMNCNCESRLVYESLSDQKEAWLNKIKAQRLKLESL